MAYLVTVYNPNTEKMVIAVLKCPNPGCNGVLEEKDGFYKCPKCDGDILLVVSTHTNTGSFRPTKNLRITKTYLCMCGHTFDVVETTKLKGT